MAAMAFVACEEKNPNDFIVDDGQLAFKQSEQIVELTPDTETVRIEMYYTEEPSEDRYGYVHLMYDAQKSTPNIERYVAIPALQKWEVAEDGTRYFILTDWFSVLVFTKIAKSYIEDYMEVVTKPKNYECKGK